MWREASENDQSPESLEIGLEKLSRKLGLSSPSATRAVLEAWPAAVGEQLAAHTEVVSLKESVLTVSVDDPRWATQLRWLAAGVVEKLNRATGTQMVNRIETHHRTR